MFDEHYSMLTVESAIAEDVVDVRGYESIAWEERKDDSYKRLVKLRIPSKARPEAKGSGLLIPMYGPGGVIATYQFRPDEPIFDGERQIKYFSPAGEACRLDIHPSQVENLQDITKPLVITEGVKKADALVSRGQTVIALSGVYNWRNKHGMLGEWEEIPLKGREVTVLFDSDTRQKQEVAYAMFRLGQWLKSKGCSKVHYLITPGSYKGKDVKGADDYFAAGGTWESLVEHASTKAPEVDLQSADFSDVKLAYRVADEVMDEHFCWTLSLGWLEWNGKYWKQSDEVAVTNSVAQWVNAQYDAAVRAFEEGTGKQGVVKSWGSRLAVSRIKALVQLCQGIEGVRKYINDFDSDWSMINTQSGVVDLTTGDVFPHRPEYLMTQITKAEYEPGFTHPDWDKALSALPDEVFPWLQMKMGQAITGYIPDGDYAIVIMQGGGENGKSTIVDAVQAAIGNGYYSIVSPQVLMSSGKNNNENAMMGLRGVRWAQLEETAEAGRLDATQAKRLADTTQIRGKLLYKDPETFDATHSLFVSTNNAPTVIETDHGSWRRLVMVNFPYTYVKSEDKVILPNHRVGDPTLKHRCKTSKLAQKAVLSWLVAGAKAWFENGDSGIGVMIPPPQIVLDTTRTWRKETDLLLQFIEDKMVLDPNATVPTSALFEKFSSFLEGQSGSRWSLRTFSQRLQNHSELSVKGISHGRFRPDENTSVPSNTLVPAKQYMGFRGIRFPRKDDKEIAND